MWVSSATVNIVKAAVTVVTTTIVVIVGIYAIAGVLHALYG